MMKAAVIGAGKTGRGFLGRLLFAESIEFSLIDSNADLIGRLREAGSYEVSFFGRARPPVSVAFAGAASSGEAEAKRLVGAADLVFVSVGAANFPAAAKLIAESLEARADAKKPILFITAENAIDPAKKLRALIEAELKAIAAASSAAGVRAADLLSAVGISESAVFCSSIEAGNDPLALVSEAYDEIPFDVLPVPSGMILPSFLIPDRRFGDLLMRKIYTYNCASAVIAYLGAYAGCRSYAEAAVDPDIAFVLDRQYAVVEDMLCRKYGFTRESQRAFARKSLEKFQNPLIADTIERNARDAKRKLASDERIIGPSFIVAEYGLDARWLALTAAAAIVYGQKTDGSLSAYPGIDGCVQAVAEVCGYPPGSPFSDLVARMYGKLISGTKLSEVVDAAANEGARIFIFGAGKIARGFVGHNLWSSGLSFTFIEYNRALADELNGRGSYTVRLLGEKVREETVTGFSALCAQDADAVAAAVASEATLVFVSVGGKNLPSVAAALRKVFAARFAAGNKAALNVVLCENWIDPAGVLRSVIEEGASPEFKAFLDSRIGIAESVVMRSAIEPEKETLAKDPLAVNVQDYHYWPINREPLVGQLPRIFSTDLLCDFGGYLDKKFYTYNAANGTVSFLGRLKGYTYISEAAHDAEILEVLEKVYAETGAALCRKHGFAYEDQMKFAKTSLAKLQNRYLVDYLERNARDPIRKLGPADRLIGPARMVAEYGGKPEGLATAIAAALFYREPSDPFAVELERMRNERGIDYMLENVCKLGPADAPLKELIIGKIAELQRKGWIKG